MNKLLVGLSFLISIICLTSQSWALPDCPTSGYKHNCYGTYNYSDLEKYSGEWQNDKRHGQGNYTYDNGDVYIGEFKDGIKKGTGTFIWKKGKQKMKIAQMG